MADAIAYRGPDDAGEWVDSRAGFALGFRRLAILDLSATGHQPMVSLSGRYVIVLNGEIYNYQELRSELASQGWRFRGQSDTEVALVAIEALGMEDALKRFRGMFAMAIWDCRERALMLARDHVGVKPLYYGVRNGVFFFASELKAIRAHPAFSPELDHDALSAYMRFAYVPAPHSVYAGIQKLRPGCWITLNDCTRGNPAPRTFWDLSAAVVSACNGHRNATEEEATEHLEHLLRDSIRRQMISDVPIGVLLSGGVDSSLVVALASTLQSGRLRTFSIGFHEPAYDEAPFAAEVARVLGTEHTELYVGSQDALSIVPSLPRIYDEPFADSSQIPTCIVMSQARKGATVVLSGDGGDEVFGGYSHYRSLPSAWKRWQRLPLFCRRALAPLARNAGRLGASTGQAELVRAGRVFQRWAQVARAGDSAAFYAADRTVWALGEGALLVDEFARPGYWLIPDDRPRSSFEEYMMFMDTMYVLPDDMLVKVDRASMRVGLEARVPLLDHHIVEYAWRLPLHLKIRCGMGKWILRRLVSKHLPRELMNRPKKGFSIPVASWLRGPLREWAETLLERQNLSAWGLFDTKAVRRAWQNLLVEPRPWDTRMWTVLMLLAWLECWMKSGNRRSDSSILIR